jgi:cysteine-rich repeat protein
VFIWVTHEPWSFRHFAPGEPDDDVGLGGNGDCIHLANAAGEWADTNCNITTFVVGRICELELNPCGDGVIEGSEECDDGNNASGDGCSATCQLEVGCGNGIVDPGEECDDDNILSFDGCSSTCHVEPGANCSATSPSLCSKLVINEIDYDNQGTDNTNGQFEFVEIWNAGTGPADVTNIALVLMNGGVTPPAEYFFDGSTGAANVAKRIKLVSALVPGNSLPPGTAIVVAPAGLVATLPAGVFSITVVPPSAGFIQNGAPDAIALFDLAAHQIVDGLAYEGPVNGAVIQGETGTFNFTEGTSTATSPLDPGTGLQSLVRRGPNARDTQDNSSDFTLTTTPSPGLANP